MIFKRRQTGVVAVFAHVDSLVSAIRALRQGGAYRFRVHSPVPRPEILNAIYDRVSPVRIWTLVGALTGFFSAVWLTVWTGTQMHEFGGLVVSGKPVNAWPAYMVIMFELTVLLGSLFTLAGFLVLSRLPHVFVDSGYRSEFSGDKFGLFVMCSPGQAAEVGELLRGFDAEEIHVVAET
jgi:molybdopterin-containing oxidoreductase family membrane subunit